MIAALTASFNGMKSAVARADAAAGTIMRAGFVENDPAVVDGTGQTPEPDLLKGVTDFQQAALAYKANLKTAEAASEMEKTLIDSLR